MSREGDRSAISNQSTARREGEHVLAIEVVLDPQQEIVLTPE